jgi:hypothetical protein
MQIYFSSRPHFLLLVGCIRLMTMVGAIEPGHVNRDILISS